MRYGCWFVDCDRRIGGKCAPLEIGAVAVEGLEGASGTRAGAKAGLRLEPGVAVGVL